MPQWFEMMRERGLTLATAESCTGGGLAREITDVAGVSAVYLGSVVAYANAVKQAQLGVSADTLARHGAVSEQTACEMAVGVRRAMNADYALSTTGVAGPDGGTSEKPVGLVWMALASPDGVVARSVQFSGDRDQIRAGSVAYCLEWLTQALQGAQS